MLSSHNWVTIVFNNSIIDKLAYANFIGLLLMYVVAYVIISSLAIVGGLAYSLLFLVNRTIATLLNISALLPDCVFRFFTENSVNNLRFVAQLTNWELLELYIFIYNYKYKEKYYEVVPEEWLPYIGLAGVRRFCVWRKSSWKYWKSRSKHRAIARARIYKIFRKPLKRRARVLYRVLNRGYNIALAVLKGKKPSRVLRRWCIRVSRRWRRLWRWFRRNIKRNIYRLQLYIKVTTTNTYTTNLSFYQNNRAAIWPIKDGQLSYSLLFLIWSILVRVITLAILFIIILL